VYLLKRNFVNILFILSCFFQFNYIKAIEAKSENIYLVKKNIIILAEKKLPKSRLLNNKKIKINKDEQEFKAKDNKQKKEINKKNKIENTLIKITIKYLPNKEIPDADELSILEEAITKLSNLNSVTIQGYAEKRVGDSSSKVRRLSLKRALFLRELFLNNNFESTRIYVRAMGYDSKISGNKDIVIISTK